MIAVLLGLWAGIPQADSAAADRLGAALRQLGDSLGGVQGAAAAFRVDLAKASAALVTARATVVQRWCTSAAAEAGRLDSRLQSGRLRLPAGSDVQARFRREFAKLRRELAQCRREWDPAAPADTLRAWGPHRLDRLEAVLRRFHTVSVPLAPERRSRPFGHVGT